MTRQRAVILEELRKMSTHPTADELYSRVRLRLPRISLGTVYRNLDFLVESHKIVRLDVSCATMRFDGDMSPHEHVRCVYCGRVGDVMFAQPMPSQLMPDIHNMFAEGFTLTKARIEYDGVCDGCAGQTRSDHAIL